MSFAITFHRTAMVIRLSVIGDLDIATSRQLDGAITEALRTDPGSLLVDLTATTFCDCAGITALLAGRRDAIAHDVTYQVVSPTGICLRVLQIFDLHRLLTTTTYDA